MARKNPSRADDMRTLSILDMQAHKGTGAVIDAYGMTNSGVQGLKGRTVLASDKIACLCTKPENKDGGMPDKWWAA